MKWDFKPRFENSPLYQNIKTRFKKTEKEVISLMKEKKIKREKSVKVKTPNKQKNAELPEDPKNIKKEVFQTELV